MLRVSRPLLRCPARIRRRPVSVSAVSLQSTLASVSAAPFVVGSEDSDFVVRNLPALHHDLYIRTVQSPTSYRWNTRRFKSSVAAASPDSDSDSDDDHETNNNTTSLDSRFAAAEIQRLQRIRNVGVFAHVDAGKTTVTERMLALAGVVRRPGSVDDGTTITDYLPAERERGITIQAAAVSFDWGWHNNNTQPGEANNVSISLIDSPGHIDFSVEVTRSVAVLDGAILVVDAVAGVQAQTETVWKAMTQRDHQQEALPCLAVVNKMDKEGSNFAKAITSLQAKLPGARPLPIQIPLFAVHSSSSSSRPTSSSASSLFDANLMAVSANDTNAVGAGEFVGVIDLIHMRAVTWPEHGSSLSVEDFLPRVVDLMDAGTQLPLFPDCPITQQAILSRQELVERLAETDARMEECYLNDHLPSNDQVLLAVRRATLNHQALPVLAAAAVRGKGVEPLLDCIADLLPSPLDRMAPPLHSLSGQGHAKSAFRQHTQQEDSSVTLGHPLHSDMLAFAFKVVHMKGRGGSGDGRVVFARVYSGEIRDRDVLHVISPSSAMGGGSDGPIKVRIERVGGMLELEGGRFHNLQNGHAQSGHVCALIGLKSVVTGDTIVSAAQPKKRKSSPDKELVCLAGVASPKPVLTVRVEADSNESQARLSTALALLAVEDPSLVIEETDSCTLLSGLGELHIEITLDRLQREHNLHVMVGPPTVTYRETVMSTIDTNGLVEYDRTLGGNRMQGAVHLLLQPAASTSSADVADSCVDLINPCVTVGPKAREFLGLDATAREEDLMLSSEVLKALVQGCQGAMQRGPVGSYALSNVHCHVIDVDAEGGPAAFQSMPGALRAVGANAVSSALANAKDCCRILEPTMSIEICLPNEQVGTVLSDLTSRRGKVDEVVAGDESDGVFTKALVRGEVPLVEILGYANALRSLTAGEAAFTAEYKGHSPC